MEVFKKYVSSQLEELQRGLQKLLEEESWKTQPSANFEINTDLSQLSKIANNLPLTFIDRTIVIFSRLNPYFHSGLLFYRKEKSQFDEVWVPCSAFHEGTYFTLPNEIQNKYLNLPMLKIGTIKKTSPYLILNPLNLQELCDIPDSSAYALKVGEQFLYVFFARLPEPWMKPHIEKIYSLICKCMDQK